MFNFIESIKEGCTIEINGNKYLVLALVKYLTESDTEHWYAKIQLENHHVLVVAPFDDYITFGYVGQKYSCEFPCPPTITFQGNTYEKNAEDYQIVKEFVFGNVLTMEGEVKYADYSFEDKIISIGLITRTSQRADVYAQEINLNDIQVIYK